MMQPEVPRGVRGVQLEDVWVAADAVLQKGERPTIERVRQHMGRGSPNTVGPMLDAWYGALGKRLQPDPVPPTTSELFAENGHSSTDLHGVGTSGSVPDAVTRAAKLLWGRAVAQATQRAEAALSAREASLQADVATLDAQRVELDRQRQQLADRAVALQVTMDAKDQHIHSLSGQLQALSDERARDADRAAALATELDRERSLKVDLGQRLTAMEYSHTQERLKLQERSEQETRRLLAEVDKARQDAKKALALADEERRKHQDSQSASALRMAGAEAELLEWQQRHQTALQQLQQMTSERDRASEQLHHQLEQQAQHQRRLEQQAALANPRARRAHKRRLADAAIAGSGADNRTS